MTINKEVLIEAILESGGAISVAAESAGCAVQTIYNHRDRDPDVAEAIETTRFNKNCRTGDLAESKLNLLIEEGYWPAIKFALSTKFKSRGYTEKMLKTVEAIAKTKPRHSQRTRFRKLRSVAIPRNR